MKKVLNLLILAAAVVVSGGCNLLPIPGSSSNSSSSTSQPTQTSTDTSSIPTTTATSTVGRASAQAGTTPWLKYGMPTLHPTTPIRSSTDCPMEYMKSM